VEILFVNFASYTHHGSRIWEMRRAVEGTYHVATHGEIVACLSYKEGILIYIDIERVKSNE
jgi:hypothetical protein